MRLIAREYCQFTGITEEAYYNDATNQLTIRRLQDVEHTLAANKAQFNMHTGKKPSYQGEQGAHHVARIPHMLIEKWQKEEGFDWFNSTDKERRARLNDRDNSKLLVRPGKL